MDDLCRQLNELQIINKELVQEVELKIKQLEEETKRYEVQEKVKIACIGVYNAGKSTLLNALVGMPVFESGDVPTTHSVQQYENQEIIYLDTPGLNVNDEDNQRAYEGYEKSDLLLFVSHIQSGGLNALEANCLNRLKDLLGSAKILEKSVTFVLTNKHRVDEGSIEKIVTEHKNNIEKVLGIHVEEIYVCDAITYENGKTQNQPLLVEASGIPKLKAHISNLAQINRQSVREERLKVREEALGEMFTVLKKELEGPLATFFEEEKKDKEKIARLEQLHAQVGLDFDALKQKLVVSEKMPRVSNIRFEPIPSDTYKKSSEEVASWMRGEIESRLGKREVIVREEISALIEYYVQYVVYEEKEENYYYQYNTVATQLIVEYIKKLKACGMQVPMALMKQVQCIPVEGKEIVQNMNSDLRDDVIRYGDGYSVSHYMSLVKIEGHHKKIFLGSSKNTFRVTNIDEVLAAMEGALNGHLNENISYLWQHIKNMRKEYNEHIIGMLEERLSLLDLVVNKQKATMIEARERQREAIGTVLKYMMMYQ